MSKNYLPTREAELVTWSNTFGAYISANGVQVGLTIEQAGAYDALQSSFVAAYQTANDPTTRSPANIEAKNLAKTALIEETRKLVAIVQAYPGTTNTMRSAMGITVRDSDPSPVSVPETAPLIDVMEVRGRTFELRLRDAVTTEKRKPAGVQGATLFTHVGDEMPESLSDWTFVASTTKTDVEFTVPVTVPAGSKVWITAFWFNRKSESGPATDPVYSWTNNGGVSIAA